MKLRIAIGGIVLLLIVGTVLVRRAPIYSRVIPPPPLPTASLVPTITPVTNQYEFHAEDSGKTALFPLTSRFQIILSESEYPKNMLHVSCNPDHVLLPISNIPSVPKPMYAVRYEGETSGICTVTDKSFMLKVDVVQ